MKFRSGTIAHVTEDWCSASRHKADTFVIDGTEGSLVAEGATITRYSREQGDEQQYEARGEFPATFAHSMRLLLEAVAEGKEPAISGRDTVRFFDCVRPCT